MAAQVACENFARCGQRLTPRTRGTGQYVEGVVKFGSHGDYNRVIQPRWHQRHLCPRCVASLLYGGDTVGEQLSLPLP